MSVKPGAAQLSYFNHASVEGWKFYPEDKHKRYWESFPLPVLLVLHDPNNGKTYWTDARQALRAAAGDRGYIEVPSKNNLHDTEAAVLFENAGIVDRPFIAEISDVLKALIATRSDSASFPISYFDLFAHGLTNLAKSIYYGTDLVANAVEYNRGTTNSEFGTGMGDTEHRFLFGFVQFLLAHDLAQIEYSDCLIDWIEREMQPHFVAPLTSRGRALVALIHDEERRLVREGRLPNEGTLHVAQEGFFSMVPESYFRRFPRISSFQERLLSAT